LKTWIKRFLLPITTLLLLTACASSPPDTSPINPTQNRPNPTELGIHTEDQNNLDSNLQNFLEALNQSEKIPIKSLALAFSDTNNLEQVRRLVIPPSAPAKRNWLSYRNRFIDPVRIKGGIHFIEKNLVSLEEAQQESGVPYQVITAIIGVETLYGKQMGNFRVKDTLATLAFNYPATPNQTARKKLFQNQLKDLVLLCWDESKTDQILFERCLNQNSSYAGAIGLPQFMPSSIRSFAVDGDGNGSINLRQSPNDAIRSVANFLKMHGWQSGMPIYLPAVKSTESYYTLSQIADGKPELQFSLDELIKLGVLDSKYAKQEGLDLNSKALIIDLMYLEADNQVAYQYYIGLENFLALVQYNRSYFYAQSVAELAQELGYQNNIDQAIQKLTKDKPKINSAKKKIVKSNTTQNKTRQEKPQ